MKIRPRAEVFCFKRSKVLCAFREDYVCFPGGGIDPGESPMAAAKREGFEEAARRIITVTVAHPPTLQLWPDDYAKRQDGYRGGLTYWFTGSTSDDAAGDGARHADYEPLMDWHPIKDVIGRLKSEQNGDWADDVRVRIKILETQVAANQSHDGDEDEEPPAEPAESEEKAATVGSILTPAPASPFPVLRAQR